jgi:hypothetical protein
MTGWEDAMGSALKDIRSREAHHAIKMARIRACNMAMFFFIMPVSSFITFAVVRFHLSDSGLCIVVHCLTLKGRHTAASWSVSCQLVLQYEQEWLA